MISPVPLYRTPLLLEPAGKNYLWGGQRLKKEYGKEIALTPLAETWECSVHPDGASRIVSGRFAGETLASVVSAHPEYLGCKYMGSEHFPILIKFIDADQDLSVQVHPDDVYAKAYEGQNGKTEMWYILDAKEGASLVYGFEHPVTKDALREAVQKGDLSKHLHRISVKAGDVFYIPAGTVHAIGAGILLAEIQENSNLTYRVYDYGRVDADGKKRELHFDKACQVMDMKPRGVICQKLRLIRYYVGSSRQTLCRCPYFEAEKIQCSMGFAFSVLRTSFQVILCLEGSGSLEAGETRHMRFKKGSCIFLPAEIGRCHVIGKCDLLKVRC